MDIADKIMTLFAQHGADAYFGEAVTQQAHALQAAYLAEQEGVSNALIVAALLHDVGHLLHDEGEDAADRGVDTRHEEDGRAWLERWFGPEVTEPVHLHVAAKRYLCAIDPSYLADLSPASVQSLALQGGPFTPEEREAFEANPYYAQAVCLRHWDDQAKIPDLDVPGVEHYRERILAAARKDA
ncbi:MAG TPA: HD domain-containing protein [Chthonomonadaceae bacterium]|nr:HD domain-containing protein [Chthonomonadaceae bacterium]